jgi:hypothetical protein
MTLDILAAICAIPFLALLLLYAKRGRVIDDLRLSNEAKDAFIEKLRERLASREFDQRRES